MLLSVLLSISTVFGDLSALTFSGHNYLFGILHVKQYFAEDFQCSDLIRGYRSLYGCNSPFEDIISVIASA